MTAPALTGKTIPLGEKERRAAAAVWNALPAMQHLGARVELDDPEQVRIVIEPLAPFHRGGMGTEAVNGAVIAGLCDAAVGLVGFFQAMGRRVGTAQLSIQLLRPCHGDRVVAVGRVTRTGAQLVFAEVDVLDESGSVCAHCDGITAIVSERTAAGPAL